jgi:hypothetical protein
MSAPALLISTSKRPKASTVLRTASEAGLWQDYVLLHEQGLAAELADGLGYLLGLGLTLAVVDRHLGAVPAKGASRRGADAGARARNKHNLVPEVRNDRCGF